MHSTFGSSSKQLSQLKQLKQKKKSEFILNDDVSAFPILKTSNANSAFAAGDVLNFASATKCLEPVKVALDELVKPGWVSIRRNPATNAIEYEFGKNTNYQLNDVNYEDRQDAYNLKKRVAQMQWDRDQLNLLLGDLSPYYNSKTLEEMLDNGDEISWKKEPKMKTKRSTPRNNY